MEPADIEILEKVFQTFVAPQTQRQPNETMDEHRERIMENIKLWELKRQFLQLLRKLKTDS